MEGNKIYANPVRCRVSAQINSQISDEIYALAYSLVKRPVLDTTSAQVKDLLKDYYENLSSTSRESL